MFINVFIARRNEKVIKIYHYKKFLVITNKTAIEFHRNIHIVKEFTALIIQERNHKKKTSSLWPQQLQPRVSPMWKQCACREGLERLALNPAALTLPK